MSQPTYVAGRAIGKSVSFTFLPDPAAPLDNATWRFFAIPERLVTVAKAALCHDRQQLAACLLRTALHKASCKSRVRQGAQLAYIKCYYNMG